MKHLIADAEGVFRLVVEGARDFAIFLLDPEGRVEMWNRGAEHIFGWPAEEIVGQSAEVLFTAEDRAAGVPQRELQVARERGHAEDTRWHLRRDGSFFFADGATQILRAADGGILGFCKIARDITDRYRTEQRVAAQLALTSLLSEERPFPETARLILETICNNLAWDIGALWRAEGERIRGIDVWHAAGIDSAAAERLATGQQLARGEGLPGKAWAAARAIWVTDFRDQREFPRAPLAIAAGMQAAFAFPLVAEGRVVGVMEFFSRVSREPDQALLPAMTLIGAQIGEYLRRRETAEALRESEQRYRLVAETAQDAIFTIDAASTILFCNSAVERLFGWAPAELIGRKLDVIIPSRLRDAHRNGVARFVDTRLRRIPWTGVELPALHRDGHEVPCEISFGVWTREDGRMIFSGFARDVTERKRAREELQQSLTEAEAARAQIERRAEEEAAFRHLASALTGAVEMSEVLYEITNRATQVTRADGVYVERIVTTPGGASQIEVVSTAGRGTPPRGLRVDFPGSLTEDIMRGSQPVILADTHGFGRSMAPYLADCCPNCELLVAPLIAEHEPLGALVLLNSRSSGRAFREADIVRARTLGDLTSLALRRVRLLEEERAAKEKAEAAVRVRDETLGIVSHDLRNPLTKIALSADLLADSEPAEQRALIDTIRTSAQQMQRLIQDLLDVARLEAGRFSVETAVLEAEPLVRHVCASNETVAEQKQQRIVCHIASPLPPICADRDRLLQVFGNLVGNAMKFTPERGTITIEAEAHGNAVRFRVRDNGPGIPEADLPNVFRPYWQAKKTAHMGAGLGLAIVRGIVEAHGGQVRADNAAGGGAVFTFTIPVAR